MHQVDGGACQKGSSEGPQDILHSHTNAGLRCQEYIPNAQSPSLMTHHEDSTKSFKTGSLEERRFEFEQKNAANEAEREQARLRADRVSGYWTRLSILLPLLGANRGVFCACGGAEERTSKVHRSSAFRTLLSRAASLEKRRCPHRFLAAIQGRRRQAS